MDFALELQSLGHRIVIVTPQASDISDLDVRTFWSLNKATSLSHVSTKGIRNKFILASVIAGGIYYIVRNFNKESVDRILCFWALPSSLISLPFQFATKIPMDTWLLGSDVWSIRNYPLGVRLLRLISKRSELLMADGLGLSKEALDLVGKSPRFLASARKVPKLELCDESGNIPYLLYVGRLHPNKGIDLLVKAYIEMLSHDSNIPNLRIYGEGPLEAELREMVELSKTESTIQILGVLSAQDFPHVASRSRGFIVPSRIESIPLVLGQAAQFAERILVTNVGDMGDLVRRNNAGVVCEPTCEALASAIENLLSISPENYQEGRRKLAKFLSLGESINQYLAWILNENV